MKNFTAYEKDLLKELKGLCAAWLKAYNSYSLERGAIDMVFAVIIEAAEAKRGDLISEEFFNTIMEPAEFMGDLWGSDHCEYVVNF